MKKQKFFADKHSFLRGKRSEIFDENFVEIKSQYKNQRRRRILLLKNACLYAENAQKMKNSWFKKCQI